MDPCVPGTNLDDLRSQLRRELGIPKGYAKNYSQKMICEAFKKCRKGASSLPPMKYSRTGGELFLIDRDSPLNARQYKLLFETGKVDDIRKIASKLGILDTDKKKANLKAEILEILEKLGINEPIKVPFSLKVSSNSNSANIPNFGNRPNINLGNRGNRSNVNMGNLPNINMGNRRNGPNINLGNRGNRSNNNNLGNKPPGIVAPQMAQILNGNGKMNIQSMIKGKKPVIKAPNVKVNLNNNGYLNNLRSSVVSIKGKKPSITKPGNKSSSNKVNKTKLLDRLRQVEELLGYNRSTSRVTTTRAHTPLAPAQSSASARTVAPAQSAAPSVSVVVGNIGSTASSRRRRARVNKTPENTGQQPAGILRRTPPPSPMRSGGAVSFQNQRPLSPVPEVGGGNWSNSNTGSTAGN